MEHPKNSFACFERMIIDGDAETVWFEMVVSPEFDGFLELRMGN